MNQMKVDEALEHFEAMEETMKKMGLQFGQIMEKSQLNHLECTCVAGMVFASLLGELPDVQRAKHIKVVIESSNEIAKRSVLNAANDFFKKKYGV
jgi:hypothetical protein